MKTIKIIDILNKIASDEELPKKIKYENNIYEYEGPDYFGNIIGYLFKRWNVITILNDEVEIIEEEKKLPEKLSTWFSLEKDCENDNIQYANHNFETMYEKINEICDYLKSKEKGE